MADQSDPRIRIDELVEQMATIPERDGFTRPAEPIDLKAIDDLVDSDDLDRILHDHGTHLLGMTWYGFSASGISYYAAQLHSGRRMYVEFADLWDRTSRLLAATEATNPDIADRRFLQTLCGSNGEAFGTEIAGSAPRELSVRDGLSFEFTLDLIWALADASAGGWEGFWEDEFRHFHDAKPRPYGQDPQALRTDAGVALFHELHGPIVRDDHDAEDDVSWDAEETVARYLSTMWREAVSP